MKKLIAFLFVLQLALSAIAAPWDGTTAAAFAGGTGTSGDPYQISTAEQLAFLASLANATPQTTNANTAGKYYILTSDIDLNGPTKSWTPIGSAAATAFAGGFDGNNHVISNIYYLGTGATYLYKGLFGYIAGTASVYAVIKNVTLGSGSIEGGCLIGGFAGRADYTTFSNCKNAASVKANTVSGTDGTTVGGIVGRLGSGSTISNCSNSGTITGSNDYAGGITGRASSGTVALPTSIQYCLNSGNVSGSTKYVAGITGNGSGTITIDQCINTGNISGTQGASGGIDGYGGDGTASPNTLKTTITNCYNTGAISGATNTSGGILAFVNATKWFYNITNCYNTGTVTNAVKAEAIAGQAGASAPTGFGVVSNCYYLSTLTVTNTNGGTSTLAADFIATAFATTLNNSQNPVLWLSNPSYNNGYPYLAWQQLSIPVVTAGASNITSAGFTANWAAVSNAISYDVMVYDNASTQVGSTLNVAAGTLSLVITGLSANSNYTYTVTAKGNNVTYFNSAASSNASVTTSVATGLSKTTAGVSIRVENKQVICSETGSIRIYNLQGAQLIHANEVNKINTNLPVGIYLVRFANPDGKQTIQKVTIQ